MVCATGKQYVEKTLVEVVESGPTEELRQLVATHLPPLQAAWTECAATAETVSGVDDWERVLEPLRAALAVKRVKVADRATLTETQALKQEFPEYTLEVLDPRAAEYQRANPVEPFNSS